MIKIQEIRELIRLIDQSSIDEFKYEADGAKIKMKKYSGAVRTVVTESESNPAQAPVGEEQAPPQPSQPAAAPAEAPAKEAKPEKQPEPQPADENLHTIESPMVGTFYASPSPDADSYVNVGDSIEEGSVVCIVEAMKLFNEIEAEVKGEIAEILVENGQLVEYGQPLFKVKPE
ncbi:acetyl-CoA carboxylase biotin carboxyl carrier protein [Bacillus marinisedimentorum]|uniref:acetyl-CoA carboxylase biotin carboxyl carrier protein n=1 Tax=Bacillus marinisedimentorum TaxID=1821260 RepID=UPI001B80B40E|nr:acetyl-CoA carboxylase biotin carboxyl carrier protein [Bacillus marinisedimentorum]